MLKFLKHLLMDSIGAMVKLVIAFGIGTGAGAVVCWYYEIPLLFSVVGGILVLGIALALMAESGFLS